MGVTEQLTIPRPFSRLEELTQRGGADLQEYRRAALERALAIGLPSTKDDRWKYTHLTKLEAIEIASASPLDLDSSDLDPHRIDDAINLVLVNGVLSSELSDETPENMTIGPLEASVLAHEFRRGPEWHPFAAWNAATFEEGLHIRVSEAPETRPVHLIFISGCESREEVAWNAPRVRIEVDPGARASFVESYVTIGAGPTLTAAVTEGFIGENASIEHIRVQDEGDSARHFGVTRFFQKRDSRVSQFQFTLGARLSRYDAETILAGEGADLAMKGAYFLHDDQSGDHQTIVDHAVPHCTSREVYRGILDDRSRGIFEGRVIVRPDAQKTSAEQSNDNLILSDTAIANSTPQLEIYADDVKCRHGSTIGRIDEKSVFYLRTRGISEEAARAMLTLGFAGAVIEDIEYESVRERLQKTFVERLEGHTA